MILTMAKLASLDVINFGIRLCFVIDSCKDETIAQITAHVSKLKHGLNYGVVCNISLPGRLEEGSDVCRFHWLAQMLGQRGEPAGSGDVSWDSTVMVGIDTRPIVQVGAHRFMD